MLVQDFQEQKLRHYLHRFLFHKHRSEIEKEAYKHNTFGNRGTLVSHSKARLNPEVTEQFLSLDYLLSTLFPPRIESNLEMKREFVQTIIDGVKQGKRFAIVFGHGSDYDNLDLPVEQKRFAIGERDSTYIYLDNFLNKSGLDEENNELYSTIGLVACNIKGIVPRSQLEETKVFYVEGKTGTISNAITHVVN